MMAKAPKPAALQVLFEPWPASAGADREGYEVFAGQYLLDALEPDGSMKVCGFRAVVAGCTTCRRAPLDDKVHYPNLNDLAPDKPKRRCPQWKKVEAIVKAFGGWKRVHYVELAEYEGLKYQSLQGRAYQNCRTCTGNGFTREHKFALRESCTDCNGSGNLIAIGPKLPDRWRMTDVQRRMRSSTQV
jgi:hypothetical protein